MRKILHSISVLCILAAGSASAKAETVTIVADEWCPYNCKPNTDKPGIFIEIAKRAFEKEGIKVVYTTVPWSRAITETREGKYTAITGASQGDAPDFVFPATAQSQSIMTFYVKKGSPWVFETMDSLKSVSLGTIADYSYGTEIDAYIENNKDDMRYIQQVAGETASGSNIKKLIKGRIGATIESGTVMDYQLARRNLAGEIVHAGALPANDDQNLYVAFSPKNPKSKKYASMLSAETDRLLQTGEMNEILARYNISAVTETEKQQ